MQTLTYEEWRSTIQVAISEPLATDLQKHHGFDPRSEIEELLKKEYQTYLESRHE